MLACHVFEENCDGETMHYVQDRLAAVHTDTSVLESEYGLVLVPVGCNDDRARVRSDDGRVRCLIRVYDKYCISIRRTLGLPIGIRMYVHHMHVKTASSDVDSVRFANTQQDDTTKHAQWTDEGSRHLKALVKIRLYACRRRHPTSKRS